MLNYLVKHTRPDLCNAVRELLKVLDKGTPQHLKDMYRTIKYVLDTKWRALRIELTKIPQNPKKDWIIKIYVDSDYAGDKDTRRSVTGYTIYVNGVLIAPKSRLQKTVSLSSCEAEYKATTDRCNEVQFIRQLLESMGITVRYPIPMYIDNVGAMFLGNNQCSTRTKHIDVRHHYIRELIDQNIIKLIFVRTDKNFADYYTKNVSGERFTAYYDTLFEDIEEKEETKN